MQLCHKQLRPVASVLSKITLHFCIIDMAVGQYAPDKNVLKGINVLVNISIF